MFHCLHQFSSQWKEDWKISFALFRRAIGFKLNEKRIERYAKLVNPYADDTWLNEKRIERNSPLYGLLFSTFHPQWKEDWKCLKPIHGCSPLSADSMKRGLKVKPFNPYFGGIKVSSMKRGLKVPIIHTYKPQPHTPLNEKRIESILSAC